MVLEGRTGPFQVKKKEKRAAILPPHAAAERPEPQRVAGHREAAQNSCMLTQYATAATKALAGMVKIQAQTMLPATPQRTALAR